MSLRITNIKVGAIGCAMHILQEVQKETSPWLHRDWKAWGFGKVPCHPHMCQQQPQDIAQTLNPRIERKGWSHTGHVEAGVNGERLLEAAPRWASASDSALI